MRFESDRHGKITARRSRRSQGAMDSGSPENIIDAGVSECNAVVQELRWRQVAAAFTTISANFEDIPEIPREGESEFQGDRDIGEIVYSDFLQVAVFRQELSTIDMHRATRDDM